MNILLREYRANIKALIIWIGCIGLLFLMASAEFDSLNGNAEIEKIMSSLPEAMVKALSLDAIRFDKVEGYYSYVAQYVMIAAAIYAGLLGSGILSKEIRKKTAETTFAMPVSRRHIVAMKALVSIANCLVMALSIFLLTVAIFLRFDPPTEFISRAFAYSGIIFLIQLLFVSAGFAISVFIQRHKRAGTLVAAIAVIAYMFSFIANIGDDFKVLKFFTPFEYFTAIDVMHGHSLDLFGFVVVPLVIIGLAVTSFILLNKKDIYT